MSFNPKNKDDKAQLYPVLKAIANLTYGKTAELVIDDAVGQPIPRGADYRRNMHRGQIDSVVAQITHRWIEKHHFALAHEVSPDIFPETPARQWRKVLNELADESRLSLLLVPSTLGVVQRESQLETAQKVIKFGQRFCLELDSSIDGHAIALQGRGEQWSVVALGNTDQAHTLIQSGINRLPRQPNGQVDPIWEESDQGITDFVVITAATDRIPLEIEKLIKWVYENECCVSCQTVLLRR